MRKFLYEFIKNLVSLIVIFCIGSILVFILMYPCVTREKNLVLWACGIDLVLIALIPTIINVSDPEKYINKFSKWITGYEDEKK